MFCYLIELLDRHDVSYLKMLEQLRVYLQRCHRETCQIRLLVPDIFDGTQRALQMNRIPFDVVTSPEVTERFLTKHPKLSHDLISRPALCALRPVQIRFFKLANLTSAGAFGDPKS
jgi:hypothetical protein